MNFGRYENALYKNRKRKIVRRTKNYANKTIDGSICGNYEYSARVFVTTIKELPDKNFGIGGKTIDIIKMNFKINRELVDIMTIREKIIRQWFEMWLRQKDTGIENIFTENAVYIESWSPQYIGRNKIKHWFDEWNTRGKVIVWDIKQFFHKDNQTVVEWFFKNEMNNGDIEEFDSISLVEWTEDNKIKALKEFGCNRNTYNPYQESDIPQFRNQKANWF